MNDANLVNCVFCNQVNFAEHLIWQNNTWHVIASLGQITNGGYVLIIPKEHISCMGALIPEQTNSMLKIVKEVCCALSLEYQHSALATPYPVTMFEHGIVGQSIKHAHLHLLPTVIDLTAKIHNGFPEAEMEELQNAAHLQELYHKRLEPYLFWTMPNGKSMVCWSPPAPLQYMRLLMAELTGKPERGNWLNMDPGLDKKFWSETVFRLKPYFTRKISS